MNKLNSPFVTGQAVLNDDFFDRENLLEEAFNFLNDNYKHVFLLFGQRRIGKTSFLLKLFNDAPQKLKVRTVFFDLQGYTDTPLPKLLYVIAQDSLQILGIDIQLNTDSFDDTDYFRRAFLPYLAQKLQTGEKLVFLFDEFDVIGAAEFIKDALPQDAAYYKFIPFLATVFADIEQKQLPVKFVFAIGRNYKDLEENRYGSLLKNGVQHEIFMFDKSIVQQLAEQTSASLPFTDQAVDKLFQLSGGHPLFAQCLADSAFRLASKNNDAKIAETLIDKVLESVIREKASAVRWIWETLPDNQKIILYLSALAAEKNQVFNITDIETEALESRLTPYTEKIIPALDHLITNRFLKKENGGYTFYVEVLRKWLIIENTIETISRLVTIFSDEQELLLKNAQFYFRKKEYKNAIDYYEKFLLQNYDNHEAFNNCATAYYETDNTDKAILYFRNAYRVSPILTNKILYMQLVEELIVTKMLNNLDTFALELELATIQNKSTDTIFIKQLEKELKTSLKQVPLAEINELKKYSALYSLNEQGNVNGLHIQDFKFDTLPVSIAELKQLSHLWIVYAALKDISPLKDLKQISSLVLSSNQISDISPLKDLKQISSLVLSSNQISDISPLKELKNIQELELKSNLISDISPLKELTNIQKLILTHNQIRDIATLKEFKYIHNLYLSHNKICDISPLKELKNIQKLGIGNNMIEDIAPLKELKNIQKLYLWRNKINDISPLKELPTIQILWLSDNQLSDLSPLIGLKTLSTLSLSNNPIKILPEWICDFPTMDIQWKEYGFDNGFIAFYDNPIENIPIEIIKQGKAAIKKYFEELNKEQQQYNFEVKLMLIGEGGTGKTSVLRKLLDKNNELPNEKDTTLGIDIQKWNYPLNKTLFGHLQGLKQDNMLVNIWDLGGQKIYHGTHQIFFGENTFYILVEETREHKTDFSYWFNTIEQLAGEKANLLVVINEKFGHVIKYDSEGYKTKFGFVNQPFQLDLSKDDEQIVKLQEFVKNAIQFLPNIGKPLPASYIRIKEALFNTGKNFIGLDTFREICSQQGITEFESVKVLSKYLHETGAITHFIDDDVLQNRVFLISEWLVKTLYKVLDDQTIKLKKGRISKEEVCKIWHSENLGFEINSLTQLMHKFGLMYKVKDQDEYVIPAHLPTEKPYAVWNHQNNGHHLIFKYEFGKYMPEGLMSHLIVSLATYIEDEINVWHRGINLMYEKSFAEIIETYGEINTFEIKIAGSQKREMLAIIRENFAKIVKPFKKLYYRELMPCNCQECSESKEPYFFIFENLQKRIEKNIFKVQCEKSYQEIDVRKLIDSVIIEEGFVDIKQLIANNELGIALNEALLASKKLKNTDNENDITLLLSRYTNNKNSRAKGILDEKDYLLERSKITNSLLSLV